MHGFFAEGFFSTLVLLLREPKGINKLTKN